jgi:hypothetical protein
VYEPPGGSGRPSGFLPKNKSGTLLSSRLKLEPQWQLLGTLVCDYGLSVLATYFDGFWTRNVQISGNDDHLCRSAAPKCPDPDPFHCGPYTLAKDCEAASNCSICDAGPARKHNPEDRVDCVSAGHCLLK